MINSNNSNEINSNFEDNINKIILENEIVFLIEEMINNNDNSISRHNYITHSLKIFVQLKNENKNNKDLLDNNIIKKLNNIIFPNSNIGNLIPISRFF